ncbi:hypothetical protein RB195_009362 [Necator americanus]|uniref:Beta-N-acetylhexosaminidase n=1 Tax=Necator americanus TaxID=51031 RepID=A0ABR1CSZ8_NECAM
MATKPWAVEISKYGISTMYEYTNDIGHATQVLWAETLTDTDRHNQEVQQWLDYGCVPILSTRKRHWFTDVQRRKYIV